MVLNNDTINTLRQQTKRNETTQLNPKVLAGMVFQTRISNTQTTTHITNRQTRRGDVKDEQTNRKANPEISQEKDIKR